MSQFKFEVKVSMIDEKSYESSIIDYSEYPTKNFYNLDNQISMSEWIRQEVKNLKTFDAPQMSSAISVKTNGTMRGRSVKNHMGYLLIKGNNIYNNCTGVCMTSECYANGNGLSVITENFHKVCAVFTARKTIKPDWLNCKDEYMAPDENHKDYEQWNKDAIVYSLFNTSSNQSSLRNVDYKDKVWQIENQWFWMSRKEMMVLADNYKNNDLYKDAKKYDQDRHVYNLLKSTNLSNDAKELLEIASELVRESFKHRESFNEEHPEYQINNWDAGWYQIKAMLKIFMKDKLDKFNQLYKAFENRMREGVYKFGFLKE